MGCCRILTQARRVFGYGRVEDIGERAARAQQAAYAVAVGDHTHRFFEDGAEPTA